MMAERYGQWGDRLELVTDGEWVRYSEVEPLVEAARELLAKEGPRNEYYRERQPACWDDLRVALKSFEDTQ